MREINLDRLRTLLAVAELGSFAQAARALHLAPPTVTQHVAELEARFGVALLLRGRRVAPTSAGQVLAARARRLLADLDELVADVRLHAKGQRGRVRLGASTGAIAHLLPPALARAGARAMPASTCRSASRPRPRRWRGWPPARWIWASSRCRSRRWRGCASRPGAATRCWPWCRPTGRPRRA